MDKILNYNGYDCIDTYNKLNEMGLLPKDCRFSYLEDNSCLKYGFKNETGTFCEWEMPRDEIVNWVRDISDEAFGMGVDVNYYMAALIGAGLKEEDVRNIFSFDDVSVKKGR